MTSPVQIRSCDIGRVVRYSSVVKADHTHNTYTGWKRSLNDKKLVKPLRGLLLGRSSRMEGAFWMDEDAGFVMDSRYAVIVAMVMPIDGTVRYRKPVAVTEFEFEEIGDESQA